MQTALFNAVQRLRTVLAEENEALSSGASLDFADAAARKNHSLLELTRLTRGLGPERLDAESRSVLGDLRSTLESNHALLSRHVRASHEVSAIIARSIEAADSDGTYSSRPEFAGRVR